MSSAPEQTTLWRKSTVQPSWETIRPDVQRLPVPSGWIYRVSVHGAEYAVCFVPSPIGEAIFVQEDKPPTETTDRGSFTDDKSPTLTTENALLLIESVRSALRNGVKHFAQDGRPLTTELEVISALVEDGEVTLHDG